jgi:glycerol-3-phosphate dehydrogenase
MPSYIGDRTPGWVFGAGLFLYDLLALKWGHRHYDPHGLLELCQQLRASGLLGGYRFFDAQTDDARLVLRVIQEAVRGGGIALNYTPVAGLLRDRSGQVHGVVIHDDDPDSGGRTAEARAPVVISATGAWADELREQVGGRRRLRRLRGSHLIFPASRLPLTRAVSVVHPADARPVFAFPWEGVTIVGTTDTDQGTGLPTDPAISPDEVEYLFTWVRLVFPSMNLSSRDVQSTLAGIRSVVDTGKANPSKESREYVLWDEHGLLTVTGGKLTTFRLMAHDALRAVRSRLPGHRHFLRRLRMLDPTPPERCVEAELSAPTCVRLLGRYGADAPALTAAAQSGELKPIDGGLNLWAEVRWAARTEGVVHLEDLLLRRVRLGLLMPGGGLDQMDQIRKIIQPELGWDDNRWEAEATAYRELWRRSYAPPS